MPNIGGQNWHAVLMPLRPQMKVLFMSGYPGTCQPGQRSGG